MKSYKGTNNIILFGADKLFLKLKLLRSRLCVEKFDPILVVMKKELDKELCKDNEKNHYLNPDFEHMGHIGSSEVGVVVDKYSSLLII